MTEARLRKVDRPAAPGWAGLLVAPLAALAALSVGHALVTPSCAWDTRLWLHVAFFLGTAVAGGTIWQSLRAWRRAGGRRLGTDSGGDGARHEQRNLFVALIGAASGAYFTLVTVAQWATVAVLSPCTY